MLRSLPSFVNPDIHASERNTDGESRNAALGSEKGSSAEKEDEVRVGVGAEAVTSCVSLFYERRILELIQSIPQEHKRGYT